MNLAISPGGKLFEGVSRALIVGEGDAVEELKEAGADAVLCAWPPERELARGAHAAGLPLVCDAGPALGRGGAAGFGDGVRAGLALRRQPLASEVALWLVTDVDVVPSRGAQFLAGACRALRRDRGGSLVAGPVEDRRAGRCAGQVVAARLGERDERELLARLAEVHLAARRRPVAVEVAGGQGLGPRLEAAADTGVAALVVRARPGGSHLDAIRRQRAWESRRLEGAPLISVLVCAFDAEDVLEGCLRSLERLSYPSYEVIVADDGSSDRTAEIARGWEGVRLLELEHRGLSATRNAAAGAARGEIVAYLDADAEAHPDWLDWLWRGFDRLGVDGLSGPNYPFADAGLQERAVSGAPGAPVPAVNPDGSAEHLPGCSMAVRRELVLDIGFQEGTATGEDVLFCNAALARGARFAYHPTAAIDHHRRESLAGYLRQQRSYGALLAMDPDALEITGAGTPTGWRSRANPFKRRYVFSGAQEQGLYAQRDYPVNTLVPLRVAATVALLGLALAPVAWLARRPRQWALATATSLAAVLAWMAALVPVPTGGRGPAGVVQRFLTAFLWLAKPVAHELGARSARRKT